MIHVVLDTNIYRKDPSRNNLHFKAIEKLSKAKVIRIHLPYVVMREFQTQQRDIYSKALTKAKSGLSGLFRRQLSADIVNKLKTLEKQLNKESENILADAEKQITNWANNIGATLYPLCLDQANAALEAYFQGKAPLKSIKSRDDIPDSFIVQSIYKLNTEISEIHVIADDGKVRDAFSNEESILTYDSLSNFIENNLIQDKLKDIDLINNIFPIADAIKKFDDDKSEILSFLFCNVGEKIVSKKFYDQSIPGDSNEAIIFDCCEAEDIEIDYSETRYYGNGKFGIPFNLNMVALACYYIFKSDYYCMNADINYVPSVTDHSDHYFEAEREFELNVHGLVSITVDRDNINLGDFSESVVDGSIEIDEITDIKLC